jgi:hypothetical protein
MILGSGLRFYGVKPFRLKKCDLRLLNDTSPAKYDENSDVRNLPFTPVAPTTEEMSFQAYKPTR